MVIYPSPLSIHCILIYPTLLTQYKDMVDLKDGLPNNLVCTVKFLLVESFFLYNTTHTDQAINQNGPGGFVIQIL